MTPMISAPTTGTSDDERGRDGCRPARRAPCSTRWKKKRLVKKPISFEQRQRDVGADHADDDRHRADHAATRGVAVKSPRSRQVRLAVSHGRRAVLSARGVVEEHRPARGRSTSIAVGRGRGARARAARRRAGGSCSTAWISRSCAASGAPREAAAARRPTAAAPAAARRRAPAPAATSPRSTSRDDDRRDGALVRVRACRELVERQAGRLGERLQHEQLRAGQRRRVFSAARDDSCSARTMRRTASRMARVSCARPVVWAPIYLPIIADVRDRIPGDVFGDDRRAGPRAQGPHAHPADHPRPDRRHRRRARSSRRTHPDWAQYFNPFSQLFLRLIKMIIAPLIFATLVAGIAGAGHVKAVGRMGLRAMIYFEVVTTIALLIGLLAGQPAQARRRPGAAAAVGRARDRRHAPDLGPDLPPHLPDLGRPGDGRRRRAADRRLVDPLRDRADDDRREGAADDRVVRVARGGDVQVHEHRHALRADRRRRGDGLHHRQGRLRRALQPGAGWSARSTSRSRRSTCSCSCR